MWLAVVSTPPVLMLVLLESQAIAQNVVSRPRPTQVNFAGMTWDVKTNTIPLWPGPCAFSDSSQNVWVDGSGSLHLKITNNGSQWTCAEVVSQRAFTYGTYSFSVSSAIANLDPNVVLGLFTYNEIDSSYAFRELDVELSRFGAPGDPTNAQFVVQPYTTAGHRLRFTMPGGPSSYSFNWGASAVNFDAFAPPGSSVLNWSETLDSPPPAPVNVHLNLWIYNSQPPAAPVEVVISNFQYAKPQIPDKVCVYQNNAVFALDANGNGRWDGVAGGDRYDAYISGPPVIGDWNGDGHGKLGVLSSGYVWLDENNNGRSDVGDIASSAFGINGGTIVSGDWNGDGRTKTGVYKNGFWFLDYNGNGIWDGPLVDRLVALGGQSGEIPITGDWNGDGRTKAGVYQNGVWALDYNGNGVWDAGDKYYTSFPASSGDKPVVGDWTGDGTTKIGVNRNGFWLLDLNGNGLWDGIGTDRFIALGGNPGEIPVVGDWNGDGRTKAGFYWHGFWALDYNGNGQWDGAAIDRFIAFGGAATEVPLIGKW